MARPRGLERGNDITEYLLATYQGGLHAIPSNSLGAPMAESTRASFVVGPHDVSRTGKGARLHYVRVVPSSTNRTYVESCQTRVGAPLCLPCRSSPYLLVGMFL